MRRSLVGLLTVLALISGIDGGVRAAPPDDLSPRKSRFTTIDLKDCRKTKAHPDGDSYRCAGLGGLAISFAEGDLRVFLSFGADAEKRRAATQTLRAFNSLFEAGRAGAAGAPAQARWTIEWRTERRGGKERPYAAIVRYFTSNDTAKGQVLVVTAISETRACHLAYVDALANPEPVALARSAADELAARFDCKSEPRVIGLKGKSPM